jgi:hypothetical protein
MSTSDPASAERPAIASDQNSPALTDRNLSTAMASLPDPAVIARLANEFFAALPTNATPDNVGASVPARAAAGGLPAIPGSQTNLTGPASKLPDATPSLAVPGSLAYFLDGKNASPLNAPPSFPSLNEAFAFPGVPGEQPAPGIPGLPGAPAVSSAPVPGYSAYFLDPEKPAPLATAPSFPAVGEMLSFPGVPGLQSVPGVPGMPSSPPTDLRAVPDTASPPPVPG